jgi:hypothetical protein
MTLFVDRSKFQEDKSPKEQLEDTPEIILEDHQYSLELPVQWYFS